MNKTRMKIYSCFAVLAAVALAAAMLFFARPARVKAESETFAVSQIFFAKPGENTGAERITAADEANGLPAYLYDEQNAGFKKDYTCSGALVLLSKTVSASEIFSTVRSQNFVISDNTADDTLVEFFPAGLYNNYYDKIYDAATGGEKLTASQAYADTSYWPPLRDVTMRIVDGADPDNFITVDFEWQKSSNASFYVSRLFAYAPGQARGAERGDGNLNLAGGALVPQSYWGNTYLPFKLYYDSQENKLYSDICDVNGGNVTKALVRDFSKAYSDDNVTWEGFKGDSVYTEVIFTGGNQDSRLLFTMLDGLSLETDENGNLISANAQAYNAEESGYYAVLNSLELNDGPASYPVPALTVRNLITVKEGMVPYSEEFTLNVLDETGADITQSCLAGLDNGKWTQDTVFTAPAVGDYKFVYTRGTAVIEKDVIVRNNKKTEDILVPSDGDAMEFEYSATPPEYMSDSIKNRQGLGIKFSKDFTLDFDIVIDLAYVGLDVPLIEYLITPAEKAEYSGESSYSGCDEFDSVRLRLTDVNDENVFVDILHNHSDFGVHLSFATVAASGQSYANNKQNKNFGSFSENNGVAIKSTFTGYTSDTTAFYYDNVDKSVYVFPDYYDGALYEVRDLDDPAQLMRLDKVFEGFPSGKVKLSLSFEGVRSESASVIIYSINGQKLSSDMIVDDSAPQIHDLENFLGVLPQGEIGTAYPFPKIEAFDLVDGNLDDKTVRKLYYDYKGDQEKEISFEGDSFVPRQTGDYTLVCTVRDNSLNEQTVEFPIHVVDKLDFINLTLSENYPESAIVGESFIIPSCSVSGGSGLKKVEFSVKAPDGSFLPEDIKKLDFADQGTYVVTYSDTDYLMTNKIFSYIISSRYSDKPVLNDVNVPQAILAGKKTVLPAAKAYDYTSFIGEKRSALVEVFVTEPGKERVKVGDDLAFTPSVSSGTVKVEYVASALLDKGKTQTKTYYTEVISPVDMSDYFIKNGVTAQFVTDQDAVVEEAVFTASDSGASMTFINPLPGNNFTVTLKGAAGSELTVAKLILTDSVDVNQRLEFTLTSQGSTSLIDYNGVTAEMEGSFVAGNTLKFDIKNNNRIYDKNNVCVAYADYAVNGDPFNGFTSGKFYMTIEFVDFGGNGSGGLIVQNLVNQPRIYKSLADNISPFILVDGEYKLYSDFGSAVALHKAFAVDILDPSASIKLTVTAPDGSVLYSQADCDIQYTLRLTQYGIYAITYRAADASGNMTTRTFNLYCCDKISPVIEIKGEVRTDYKVGDALSVPACRATDNYTAAEEMTVYVMIINDKTGYIQIVDEEGFEFENAGSYTLRFFAEDEFKNYSIREFKLSVTD